MDETGRTGRSIVSRPHPESVWVRTVVGWNLAFWLMVAIAAVGAVVADDVGRGDRLGSLAALAAVGAAYGWLTHRRGHERVPRNVTVYLTVLAGAVAALIALEPSTTYFLFIAYPQVWYLTWRVRVGAAWATVVTVAAFLGFGLRHGFSTSVLRDVGPQLVVSLLFSLLLGIWIARVIDQSRQRAELIGELERTRAELGVVSRAAGVVAERERLAREIHDTLAQGFTSVIALAQAERARLAAAGDDAPRLATLEATARDNLAEARALVAAFSPLDLQGTGLPDALRRLADRFTAETGVTVALDLPADPGGGLDTGGAVVLLRVVQEALANVRQHARAAHVTLRLRADPDGTVGVEVADDGAGFTVEVDGDDEGGQGRGYGLSGMRARVEEVGGRLAVDSRPGGGTRVVASLP